MKGPKIEFDRITFNFREVGTSTWRIVRAVLIYLTGCLTVAVLVYGLIALFFSTDAERRLHHENRMYRNTWSTLTPKAKLVEDVVAGLQYKDNDLYEQVFHSAAPDVDPLGADKVLFASDTIPDDRLNTYTADKADGLLEQADSIEALFAGVVAMLSGDKVELPPMSLPLENVAYYQVGASTGKRLNPMFKAYVNHDGLDFIVPRGTPVLAAAEGTVKFASSMHSTGKMVKIEHPGGYETQYAHLENMKVRPGQRVKKGQEIGTVGMSGSSFAPHLHYAIYNGAACVDPVNHLFASVSPEEYAKMLYMAVNTVQSMD